MKKSLTLAYAGAAYLLAMANIVYIVAFLADYGVPKTINSGRFDGHLWPAVALDIALVLGFGVHHSVTARRSFKSWWTRCVPPHLERATYLWMTAAATAVLVVAWRPIPVTLWQVQAPWAVAGIYAALAAVWGAMFAATFHIGHFGFFGLTQALDKVRERRSAAVPFSARYLYAVVRHPISLGWMIVPWITPHMTVGQFVFAIGTALYVLAATSFEEADLEAEFGDQYRRYRREVPAFVPGLRRDRRLSPTAACAPARASSPPSTCASAARGRRRRCEG